jgi:hypothetical protein
VDQIINSNCSFEILTVNLTFALLLSHSIKVVQQILILSVEVRILVGQLIWVLIFSPCLTAKLHSLAFLLSLNFLVVNQRICSDVLLRELIF